MSRQGALLLRSCLQNSKPSSSGSMPSRMRASKRSAPSRASAALGRVTASSCRSNRARYCASGPARASSSSISSSRCMAGIIGIGTHQRDGALGAGTNAVAASLAGRGAGRERLLPAMGPALELADEAQRAPLGRFQGAEAEHAEGADRDAVTLALAAVAVDARHEAAGRLGTAVRVHHASLPRRRAWLTRRHMKRSTWRCSASSASKNAANAPIRPGPAARSASSLASSNCWAEACANRSPAIRPASSGPRARPCSA
mmetsp:Transcript_22144/g.87241  ORF Transcript_22144/g.87241 Transcript_22144/m.87241 type:complete len:258 (-) Transcript_22144:1490-2263(-)